LKEGGKKKKTGEPISRNTRGRRYFEGEKGKKEKNRKSGTMFDTEKKKGGKNSLFLFQA